MKIRLVFCLLLLCLSFATPAAVDGTVPTPKDVLGFQPGEDRKLASWAKVVEYFERLDQSSDRVSFQTIGKTTMARPFVVATISTPENLARLDEYKDIQAKLADPRKLGPLSGRDQAAKELMARGKTIVLITCGIHSTEVGSYLSSMLIAYRLASSNEPEIKNILQNTIILLVPSLNPDGVDIVKNWYDKTLGTPYEGTDPPELYHKYTGHDNNRDWYAFTQVETQLTVDKIHNEWHPQIVHDIHQQGAFGSRLFLPPYMRPVEPNVPKQIVEGYTELGNWMAREMRAQGFQGITTDSTYDAWSPSRAYSHYHGGVRILSETASAKIATPIKLKFEELNSREGYDPRKESKNFGPLWRGGEWGLRNITRYMTTAAFLLLDHAAKNRESWLQRFYEIGKAAVRPPKANEMRYLIIPPSQHSSQLTGILERAGVQVQYPESFEADGDQYSIGTAVIPLDQPYGAFARAILLRQLYPDLRDRTGHPIEPYDVTAHALPLLFNVRVRSVSHPLSLTDAVLPETGSNGACGDSNPPRRAIYRSSIPTMDEGWTRWVMERNGRCLGFLTVTDKEVRKGNLQKDFDTIVIPDQSAATILSGYKTLTMPPELTGGIGESGVKALKEFVEAGGTLVCLNQASDFAIKQFRLPVVDVVEGLSRTKFYVPGSILRIELKPNQLLTEGMAKDSIAWVENSPVFDLREDSTSSVPVSNATVIARYPQAENPLLSGWLLGAELVKGKAALVEVKMGKGRFILFGFRPQYRGQSLATLPLFFKSLECGGPAPPC
jgi:zinc carboxypeptidase